jgi:hypothetical protein
VQSAVTLESRTVEFFPPLSTLSDSTMTDADTDSSPGELAVSDDLRVAAVAAVTTVALTLVLQFAVATEIPILPRLSPLGPYFLYVFSRRVNLGALDTVRNWSLLTVAVALGVFVFYAI